MHKIGNIGIIANFVFPYIGSFLPYLQHMMLVNMKLEIHVIGLQFKVANVIGPIPFTGTAKTKLGILAVLYCGEFVKNP